jgi:hypothetical protein
MADTTTKTNGWRELDISGGVFDAPRVGGCYAIYVNNVLSYIGQASDLRIRLVKHLSENRYSDSYRTPWGTFAFREVRVKVKLSKHYGDWAMWELRLLRRVRPPFNRLFLKPGKKRLTLVA